MPAREVVRFRGSWMLYIAVFLGLLAGLPFLAPVFMKIGWESPARFIYFIYSLLCHQLPQRSYFLFGTRVMYSLPEIQATWKGSMDPLVLRQFIGNAEMGWKVAWSDRMVFMFTSLWVLGLSWRWLRRWLKPLPWWGLVLFLLPMVIDGGSHFISDLAGIGQGFRDSNAWLGALTNQAFTAVFYMGDAWGSFNSIMRMLSGVLFGLGITWFCLPYLQASYLELVKPGEPNPQTQHTVKVL